MHRQTKPPKRISLPPQQEALAIDLVANLSSWLQEPVGLVMKLQSFAPEEKETFLSHLVTRAGEQILPLLETISGKDESLDQAIVRGVGRWSSAQAAEFLHRFAGRNPSKNVQKEIRRAIFRLKSSGVIVPEIADPSPGVFRVPEAAPAEGYVSAIDASGSRLVWLARPQPPQGMAVVSSLISDTEGILDFSAFESSRKKFHEYIDQMRRDFLGEIVEAAPLYCAGLIQEAHELHVQKGKPPHPDYLKFRMLWEPIPALPLRPLIYQFLSLEEIRTSGDLQDRSPSLFQIPSFEHWYLGKEETQKYKTLLEEVSQSRIILSPHQQEGRIFEVYRQAVQELFDERRRLLLRRRLEEMAYFLWKKGFTAEARISLAVADGLAEESKILSPPPFLLELVKRTLSAYREMEEKEEEKEKESVLITRP